MIKRVVTIVVLSGMLATSSEAQPISWLMPVDGMWSEAMRWDLQRIPGLASDEPVLGLSGMYTVRSGGIYAYSRLHIQNLDARLWVEQGVHTTGSVSNDGLLTIGDAGTSDAASLRLSGSGSIEGTGTVELQVQSLLQQAQIFGILPMTHGAGHTIMGDGEIFASVFQNNGSISASGPHGLRLYGFFDQSNTGAIGADTGRLRIPNLTVIEGGNLFSINGGQIVLEGGVARFRDLSTDADIVIEANDQELVLEGIVVNEGLITLDARSISGDVDLTLTDGSVLDGAGIIRLLGNTVNSPRLKLAANNTATIGQNQVVETNAQISLSQFSALLLNGQLRSLPGDGPLELAVNLGGTGEIVAYENDVSLKGESEFRGLTFRSEPGYAILVDAGRVRLNNVTNNGSIELRDDNEILDINGEFINNGTVRLGLPTIDKISYLNLYNESEINGSGVVELVSFQGEKAKLEVETGTAYIGEDQTIQGHGEIRAVAGRKLVNRGTVRSTDPNIPLYLLGDHSGDGAGRYISDQAGILFNATLSDATVETSVGSEIICEGGVFKNVTADHPIRVLGNGGMATSANFGLEGSFELSQSILLEAGSGLAIGTDSSVTGSGTINMLPGSYFGTFTGTTNTALPSIARDVVVRGSGLFDFLGDFEGTLIADIPGSPCTVDAILFMDEGRLIADHADIVFDRATLVGGTLESSNSSHFRVDERSRLTLEGVHLTGRLEFKSSEDLSIFSTFINDGELVIRGFENFVETVLVVFNEDCNVTGSGQIALELPESVQLQELQLISRVGSTTTVAQTQSIEGSGRLEGRFQIDGTLSPGGFHRAIQLRDVAFGPDATTRLEIGGTEPMTFDQLQLLPGGILSLAGTLQVELDQGYTPNHGDSWVLIRQIAPKLPSTLVGQYDQRLLPEPDKASRYVLSMTETELVLSYTCIADINGDLTLNFFDIAEFIQLFSSADPGADINADGILNFFDVSAFVAYFQEGCS